MTTETPAIGSPASRVREIEKQARTAHDQLDRVDDRGARALLRHIMENAQQARAELDDPIQIDAMTDEVHDELRELRESDRDLAADGGDGT